MKKFALTFILLLALCSLLVSLPKINIVRASETIYIRPDGTVEGTDKIQRDGTVYTFTGNINDSIVVERDNIVVDGAGYLLQGIGISGTGISVSGRHNVTIKNTGIRSFEYGIRLSSSSNNTVSGNTMTNNGYDGIHLLNSSSNTICGNNITANIWDGILLDGSSSNTIYGNNIEENLYGIHLLDASNNSICGDNITDNYSGIWLERSSNNTFRNNNASNNKYNFVIYWVYGLEPSHFIHDIDDSNTVEGKPVYYWVNKRDMAVPLDAGYVALVNCTNITVKNLNLANNGQGILLAFTTDSTITKNNVTDNYCSIWHCWSSNNTVSGNNITNSGEGIRLDSSSNNCISGNNITANWFGIRLGFYESSNYNTISRNQITNNEYGIWLDHSSNNTISENTVTNNQHGIYLADASNYNSICGNSITNNEYGIYLAYAFFNTVYHNNFIGNAKQVYDCFWEEFPPFSSINTWDDGYPSGGNYWSDYNGTDVDQDGIGDTTYNIDANNQDNYPLMGMFYDFRFWDVNIVISNSTIRQFSAGYHMNSTTGTWEKCIMFHVLGTEGTVGFCRVLIPREFMESPYNVLVNNEKVNATELSASNNTHVFLYFAYTHSGIVMIVPEFPTWTSILLLFIVLTVATVIYKRRLLKTPIH